MPQSKGSDGQPHCWAQLCAAALAFIVWIVAASGALAAPRPIEQPIPNPPLTKACGLNVLMILDESGSIATSNATQDVRNAFKAFTGAIKNTSSAMAVAEFSRVARLPAIGSFPPGEYITVTDSTKVDLDAYINNDFNPNGNTNWEDGLRMGIPNFAPRNNFQVPHLTVFITDGDPNQVIRDSVTATDYANKVPLADSQTTGANQNTAADHAVANANNLKTQGSRILAIAVGAGLSSNASLNRLIRVSGPNVYNGTGDFDISTDDIYREPDFSKLQDALRQAAFQLCAPSVTVQKLVDQTPDPGTTNDAVPGVNWTIMGTVTAPGSGGYDWVLPVAESPGAGPKSANTDTSGFATFQWLPDEAGPSGFTAMETIQSGFTNAQGETRCTFRTPDSPSDQPLAVTPGNGSFSTLIPQESIVTCQFVNVAVPAPAITLKKYTEGSDADTAPDGPDIPVGQQINWTYVVTNTGNTTLNTIAVTDAEVLPIPAAPGPTVSCPKTMLIQGESITCTATGISGTRASGSGFTGQYQNIATVTAVDSYSTLVTASDPSHYVAAAPGISIEKATNGQDADTAPGPLVAPGSPVTWSYVVTNTGTETLNGISVIDDREGAVTCPQATLVSGVSMTCANKVSTATPGQYANRATVTGAPAGGGAVTDEDPSHYFGVVTALSVKKATNGVDADVPPGPAIVIGDDVYWTYVVTNTGNVPFTSWTVTDSDPSARIACPRVILGPSASATCVAKGIAGPGQYANTATASTPNPLGGPDIIASDPSHYFGAQSALALEKTTNGQDADDPPGPFISVGQPVTWSYAVTNTGNTPLTNLLVIDSKLGAATCNTTALAVGGSTTCSLNGVATAGQYLNLSLALARGADNNLVGALDPSHYFGAAPGIHLEKLTNGVDADTAPGPYIIEGNPVDWSYEVTNTGNNRLTNITLTDDRLGPITCPQTALEPQVSVICTATGIAATGQYANVATVAARDTAGVSVSDTDPSHYFGYISAINVEKATNGQDADDAPIGPIVPVGSTVTWTYQVTNPGDIALKNVRLTDNQGVAPVFQNGDTNGNNEIDPGETWLYQAQGIAVSGQYANIATATAVDVFENPVQDTDPSHYYGLVLEPSIDIEKATNGVDADNPPGPRIEVGETARFTYVVTNTGNAFLRNVTVTDNQGVTVTCPSGNPIPVLEPGSHEICTASRVVTEGQYVNVGAATGRSPDGRTPSDSDPSHHLGTPPFTPTLGISIEKATNGEDADTPPGPTLPVGATANFTYVVRNTGNIPLTNVTVTDDQGVIVTCPSGNPIPILRRGRSETCTGSATVSPGQYTNRGSATGTAPDGSLYSDSDPSHHFGGPANTNPRDIPTLSMLGLSLLALLLGGGVSMSRKIGRTR